MLAACKMLTNARVTRLYRSSNEPAHPTQNRISGACPFDSHSAIVTTVSIHYFFSSLAQLNRSAGENFQGAKLVSMFWNIEFQDAGAPDSSIATYRRSSRMISSGLIITGHASTHALQLVQ